MKGLINGITSIINFFKTIFDIIMGIFETFAMVFKYLISIVQMAFDIIATLPSWISVFAIITIALSIAYFLIGRSGGKND